LNFAYRYSHFLVNARLREIATKGGLAFEIAEQVDVSPAP
jgi:hypothetical protein